MRSRAFVISVINLVAIAFPITLTCPAADISAEMSALLSDVLKPYQLGGAVPPRTERARPPSLTV